ncbi:MAG: hypothetical protein OHK0019_16080 [Saprospiraceae bacterium]
MKKSKLLFLLFLGSFASFFLFLPNTAQAQNVGVGFQAGAPTGLNLHFRNTKPMRLDILFAWDFDDDDRDFFFVNVHGLFFKPLSANPKFNFYYGPGAYIGVRDRDRPPFDDDDETVLGFSGNFGLNLEIDRFDIFLQLTPRLDLVPDTDFDIGGGLGARFFF